jgi:uncharacterized coiled-coil protein SlyX
VNGAQHFAEAERLIDLANDMASQRRTVEQQSMVLAAAQVHATLALAASQLRSLVAEANR